ncbi:restriction endonuclease subunit S [Actinoplanes sp. NPDC049668]|uniref:restriction endonuclease subunit S n=1 Tax=unclassified Actinoplanes TaxID=2626549 RepID=UPI0033ACE4FC
MRLKDVVHINRRTLQETTSPDYDFHYIDISSVDGLGNIVVPEASTAFGAAPSRARRLAPAGATVVSTVRTYLRAIGRVPRSDRPLVFSTGFAVIEAGPRADPGFLYYLCRSEPFVQHVVARSVGVSYPAVNPGDIGDFPIDLPPVEEQRRVAEFLDAELARAGVLRDAKQRQAALLAERAETVLAEKVSELFDAHGSVAMRYLWRGIEQGWSPQCEDAQAGPDEWAVLRTSAVSGGVFDPLAHKRLPADVRPDLRYLLHDGDLLLTRGSGSPAFVGVAAVARPGGRRLLLSDLLYRVRLPDSWPGALLAQLWGSRPVRDQIALLLRGQSGQTIKLRGQDIGEVVVPRVPADARARLAAELEEIRARHAGAAARIGDGLDLMAERRQALITAAVTGRLDVTTARGRVAA